MEGTKKDAEYWIIQFNNLRETIKIDKWSFCNHVEYMDLYIYKGDKFYSHGFLEYVYSSKKAAICHIQLKLFARRFKKIHQI